MTQLDPASILGPGGAVARRLPAYELRDQQLQMADAVARAIERPGHLIVEAGTGVGKSFAYLVPAILAAVEQKKKVVVSTHTIALQEQLLRKDIPFLRSVMPQEFSAVLVKGRSNYISLRRLDVATARARGTFQRQEEFDQLGEIRLWANRTTDGTRSDLDFRPLGSVWDAVQSENGNCLGRDCPRNKECFYFQARRRVWSANLLIVNHALFVSDLALRASGLRAASRVRRGDLRRGPHAGGRGRRAHGPAGLERRRRPHAGAAVQRPDREGPARLSQAPGSHGPGAECPHGRRRLLRRGRRLAAAARRRPSTAGSGARSTCPTTLCEDAAQAGHGHRRGLGQGREAGAPGRADRRAEPLPGPGRPDPHLDRSRPAEDQVYWVELEERARRRIRLASAPLDVGPSLRKMLFEKVPTCILTSATLCVGTPPKFDFLKTRLGLTAAETHALGSPFDYPNQVTIHLPRNLPDPSDQPEDFERVAIKAIAHYLERTQGKAFVLFTSYKMLDAAARALTPWLAERNIALFAQSDGMPRSKMVEAFKADVNSVIFGADSFWQGVDVPGEALSNVIIVRLPFSVPSHPLLEARLEDIRRRGGNPFVEYQVPEAVIKLKQGFGRLIRTRTDRGIVVILDPRVMTKPYGRTFLSSLPDCPRIVEQLELPGSRG